MTVENMAEVAPWQPRDDDAAAAALDAVAATLAGAALALGRAGCPTEALRLAAAGYAAVRRTRPAAAQELNAVMHRLARLTDPTPIPEEDPWPTAPSTCAPRCPPAATS